jgi:DNA-directed RNA polymerase specialized sigma24 family protein
VTRLRDIVIDDALLREACAGRESAQRALYLVLAPATLTLIRRLVGHRALSEDIFQDTMMTFYQRLPQFRREAPLSMWLRSIAIRRCLMYLRSPWQRARLCLEPVDFGVAAEVTALITPGYGGELIDLERALASLAPTARAVVWMYEVEGYSHEEIAREFGRSVSFSKSQLARAHRRLRAWFGLEENRPSCSAI